MRGSLLCAARSRGGTLDARARLPPSEKNRIVEASPRRGFQQPTPPHTISHSPTEEWIHRLITRLASSGENKRAGDFSAARHETSASEHVLRDHQAVFIRCIQAACPEFQFECFRDWRMAALMRAYEGPQPLCVQHTRAAPEIRSTHLLRVPRGMYYPMSSGHYEKKWPPRVRYRSASIASPAVSGPAKSIPYLLLLRTSMPYPMLPMTHRPSSLQPACSLCSSKPIS